MREFKRDSPAKINIYLKVHGKLPSGMHLVESCMLPLDFCDHILLRIAEDSSSDNSSSLVGIKTSFSKDLIDDGNLEDVDTKDFDSSSNLAFRAAKRFLSCSGIKAGIEIQLSKNIPLQAGLGGGSGNAATVLKILDEAFPEAVSKEELYRIAESLGHDVPGMLLGGMSYQFGECGEAFSIPIDSDSYGFLENIEIILIKPRWGNDTGSAYRALERQDFVSSCDLDLIKSKKNEFESRMGDSGQKFLSLDPDKFFNSLENDFSKIYFTSDKFLEHAKVYQRIRDEFRKVFTEFFTKGTLTEPNLKEILCGSGSTTAFIFDRSELCGGSPNGQRALVDEMMCALERNLGEEFFVRASGVFNWQDQKLV